MSFPILKNYLARLSDAGQAASSVRLAADGKAQGHFFNCTMTSAFQPIRRLDTGRIIAFEGLARGVSASDAGLSLWKLLDHAASDDESVELDRLCRMLHAINFFRQCDADRPDQPDLYLSVHNRLLSAVSSNHGHQFQRILDALGLPVGRIVLQLPAVTPNQHWLFNYVSDNYRRNGFRLALNARRGDDVAGMLARLRPDALKLDARDLDDPAALATLVTRCHEAKVDLLFRRLERLSALETLRRVGAATGLPIFAEGYLLDAPAALLAPQPRMASVA